MDCADKKVLCVGQRHPLLSSDQEYGGPSELIAAPSVSVAVRCLRDRGPFDLIVVAADLSPLDGAELIAGTRQHADCTPVIYLPEPPGRSAAPDPAQTGAQRRQRDHDDGLQDSCRQRVLVVDDDPACLLLLERFLSKGGYDVMIAENGIQALRILLDKGAQIVVSDWMMPEMDGIELCREIRSNESVGFVYFIVVTAHAEKKRVLEAFQAGADDYLTKPLDREELLFRMRAGSRNVRLEADFTRQSREIRKVNAEMAILNNKLHTLATIDELSGLANRRRVMEKLQELWDISERYKLPLSCITLDLDHFKRVNDAYGHDAGDALLKAFARLLNDAARATDVVSRIGGEEFLIITPNTDTSQAVVLAERIRAMMQSLRVDHRGDVLNATVSIGLVQKGRHMAGPQAMLKEADVAMYNAKDGGRNRVCVAKTANTARNYALPPPADKPAVCDSDPKTGDRALPAEPGAPTTAAAAGAASTAP